MIKWIKKLFGRLFPGKFTTERKIEILQNVIQRINIDMASGWNNSIGLCHRIKLELNKFTIERQFDSYVLANVSKVFKIHFPETDKMYKWPRSREGNLARIAECEAAIERLKNEL